MRTAYKFVSLVILLVVFELANGNDNKSLSDKCGEVFQKVAACLTYATGKSPAPSKECCVAAEDIKDKDPVCLCYIVEQILKGSRDDQMKSMGIQEDKLLQLPSACKLANTSISNCPKLLNIPPNSPDYAIFTNASTASKTPVSSPARASSSSSPKDSSNGFKNGPQLSITGTIVAAVVVAVILSAIPKEQFVF